MINLAVLGATGRMGQAILSCMAESKSFRLSGAVTVVSCNGICMTWTG